MSAPDGARPGRADAALEAIDRALNVERHILAHERRATVAGEAVDACWRRIDQLLEQRLVARFEPDSLHAV